jgi:hypothetical protein
MHYARRKRHPPASGCISFSKRTPSTRTSAGGAGPAARATKTRRSCCQVLELPNDQHHCLKWHASSTLLEHVGCGAQGASLERARVTLQMLEALQKFAAGAAAVTMLLMTASTCQHRHRKALAARQPRQPSSSNSSSSRVPSRAGAAAGRHQAKRRSWRGSCMQQRRRSPSCRPASQQTRRQRSRPPPRTRELRQCTREGCTNPCFLLSMQ